MSSVTAVEIIGMSEKDLVSRKTSCSKQELVEALLLLKQREKNEAAASKSSMIEEISSVIDKKLDEKLKPFMNVIACLTSQVNNLELKCQALEVIIRDIKPCLKSISILSF